MKKLVYILLAASAIVFASCTKEARTEDAPVDSTKYITFTASIDIPDATRAALNGIDIKWTSGDYIGVATDNNSLIVAYPVVIDADDPTHGTISVVEVPGATAYYAVFKGSLGADGNASYEVDNKDFTGIVFDKDSKTFNGLKVGNQQVAANSLTSHLWYTNGFPLAMVGKSDGTSLVMKPCLALVKVQINSESVPDYYFDTEVYTSSYGIDHNHDYSAVRGFNLYQKGASTIYSSGSFKVQVNDDGSLVTTSISDKEYRQISQSEKLQADTPYYMCLIPGGDLTSFHLDFLGYSDTAGSISWNAVYSMTLPTTVSVDPGDFFDLGTLNPLGLKREKDQESDEAYDAASATYVPAAVIDGSFGEWDDVTALSGDRPNGSSNTRISEWKVLSDELNIYLYIKLFKEKVTHDRYLYVGFDFDKDESTGTSHDGIPGLEAYAVIYPSVADSSPAVFVNGTDTRSHVYPNTGSSSSGVVDLYGVYDDESAFAYVELSIPRDKINIASGSSMTMAISYNNYTTGKREVTL